MPDFDFDAVVVGAGAVGLACARELGLRGLVVAVLERDGAIGQGVSSRNSEVVHAGLYYPTASLRARLCVRGRRLLYAYCDLHRVDYDRCGKLVVAQTQAELERLEAIVDQAWANGVEDTTRLTRAMALSLEPDLSCEAALLSPQTGVFDSHAYMRALKGDIEDAGGAVVGSTPFERATPLEGGGFVVHAGGADPVGLTCRVLVTAPGLSAQAVASAIEGYPESTIPKAYYGKGVYFRLQGKAPFRRLIYPTPIPGALGTHYRRDLGGQGVFGPNLTYVDEPDYAVDPASAGEFYQSIRKFWPALPEGALTPDYAGVRPKLHGPGETQSDFRIDDLGVHGLEGLVTLFGIESPGLTSSLAIAQTVADMLGVPA